MKSTLIYQIFITLGILILSIVIFLFLDSKFFLEYSENGQHYATIIFIIVFFILYYNNNARIREQMIYAFIIGLAGEYFFSLGLGMYTYRLANIPHYVPFGHVILFVFVTQFIRQPKVVLHKNKLEKILYIINAIVAFYFLLFKNDVLGFSLSLITFYIVYKKPRERLFYLAMYFVIVCLEITGTFYESWWWPKTWFGKIDFIPSANPPSGISLFYFGLDLGCLYFYKLRHKVAWSRMKNIRQIRLKKLDLH